MPLELEISFFFLAIPMLTGRQTIQKRRFGQKYLMAGLPRARRARGTEPHTHRLWSTSFPLVVT